MSVNALAGGATAPLQAARPVPQPAPKVDADGDFDGDTTVTDTVKPDAPEGMGRFVDKTA